MLNERSRQKDNTNSQENEMYRTRLFDYMMGAEQELSVNYVYFLPPTEIARGLLRL